MSTNVENFGSTLRGDFWEIGKYLEMLTPMTNERYSPTTWWTKRVYPPHRFRHKRHGASDLPKLGESLNIRPLVPRSIEGTEILPEHVPLRGPLVKKIFSTPASRIGKIWEAKQKFARHSSIFSPKILPLTSTRCPLENGQNLVHVAAIAFRPEKNVG